MGCLCKRPLKVSSKPSWVIPERALHGNRIYLMSPESRLEIRTIEVLYRRDNQVVINGDIEQGERLVLNDLLPAIDGMMLREATVNSVNSTGANQVGDES